MRQGFRSGRMRGSGRYRPPHAWLGSPGDGVPLKRRSTRGPWHFRWLQLRILLIAVALGALAWSQIPDFWGRPAAPPPPASHAH